jgi:hypothetical protein
MTIYDRASVTVGVILVGVVLLLVLEMPSRTFQFNPLGTPLTVHITGTRTVSVLLVGLACAGTEAIMRTHPLVRRRVVRYTFTNWILPGLTTLALTLFLPQSPSLFYWLIGMILGGAVIAWLMLVHYQLVDSPTGAVVPIQIVRSLIAYVLALVFFASISRTRMRSLVTATSITALAMLISLTLLGDEKKSLRRTILYAAMIGLVLGETTWALNYWRVNVLTVGVLLMLIFYVLVGIAREHIRGTLDRRALVEFLAVVAVGLWIVIRFGRH